jgi:hypothetical protein
MPSGYSRGWQKAFGADAVYFTRGYVTLKQEGVLQETFNKAGIGGRRFGGHLLFEPEAIQQVR